MPRPSARRVVKKQPASNTKASTSSPSLKRRRGRHFVSDEVVEDSDNDSEAEIRLPKHKRRRTQPAMDEAAEMDEDEDDPLALSRNRDEDRVVNAREPPIIHEIEDSSEIEHQAKRAQRPLKRRRNTTGVSPYFGISESRESSKESTSSHTNDNADSSLASTATSHSIAKRPQPTDSDALAHMFDDDVDSAAQNQEDDCVEDIAPISRPDKGKGKAAGWATGASVPPQTIQPARDGETTDFATSALLQENERLKKELAFKEEVIKAHKALTTYTQSAINCQICMDTYDDPLTLACGHTFCRSCLYECFHSSKSTGAINNALGSDSDSDDEEAPAYTDRPDRHRVASGRMHGHEPRNDSTTIGRRQGATQRGRSAREASTEDGAGNESDARSSDASSVTSVDGAASLGRDLRCPACRHKVTHAPFPVFAVREIADRVRAEEAAGGLLHEAPAVDPATGKAHRKSASNASRNSKADKAKPEQAGPSRAAPHPSLKDKTWGGLFPADGEAGRRRPAMRDEADGVLRCSRCAWELSGNVCFSCGAVNEIGDSDAPMGARHPLRATGTRFGYDEHDDSDEEDVSEFDDEEEDEEGNSSDLAFINDEVESAVRRRRTRRRIESSIELDEEHEEELDEIREPTPPPTRKSKRPVIESIPTDTEEEDAEMSFVSSVDEDQLRRARLARFGNTQEKNARKAAVNEDQSDHSDTDSSSRIANQLQPMTSHAKPKQARNGKPSSNDQDQESSSDDDLSDLEEEDEEQDKHSNQEHSSTSTLTSEDEDDQREPLGSDSGSARVDISFALHEAERRALHGSRDLEAVYRNAIKRLARQHTDDEASDASELSEDEDGESFTDFPHPRRSVSLATSRRRVPSEIDDDARFEEISDAETDPDCGDPDERVSEDRSDFEEDDDEDLSDTLESDRTNSP